jgi:CrcB protein
MDYVWVALGGALGSVARYWCSGLVARLIGESFPWGTLVVNVLGSFVIGAVAALSATEGRIFISADVRIFIMVGICGGYTTFSSFSLQTLNLMRDAEWFAAAANIGFSIIACLLAVWVGHLAGSAVNR